MTKSKELKDLIAKLDRCSESECKGILYFVCGGMSNYKGVFPLFLDLMDNAISASTWQRKEK